MFHFPSPCRIFVMVGQLVVNQCSFIREVIRMPVCKAYCPPRLPLLEFRQLTWLPDPQFMDAMKDHYKAFDDSFGQGTIEVDHPGAKTQENKSVKACFTKEVCDTVEYVSCGNWRCLYAPTKQSHISRNEFHQAVNILLYTCSTPIFQNVTVWQTSLPYARIFQVVILWKSRSIFPKCLT